MLKGVIKWLGTDILLISTSSVCDIGYRRTRCLKPCASPMDLSVEWRFLGSEQELLKIVR